MFSHIFSWKDSKTYLSLGIPPERVFTVGKKGKRNVVYDETEMSVEREKKKNKRRFIRIKRKLEEDAEGNSDDEEKHENEMNSSLHASLGTHHKIFFPKNLIISHIQLPHYKHIFLPEENKTKIKKSAIVSFFYFILPFAYNFSMPNVAIAVLTE